MLSAGRCSAAGGTAVQGGRSHARCLCRKRRLWLVCLEVLVNLGVSTPVPAVAVSHMGVVAAAHYVSQLSLARTVKQWMHGQARAC